MKCSIWDSSAVQPASEFDYYHSGLCQAFAHLTPFKPEKGERFFAKMEHWSGDVNEFTFLKTASHRVMRSKHDIGQAEDKDVYLNFIEKGELHLEQDGVRRILRRGQLAIIDNSRPFDVQIKAQPGHRHLAFRINRDKLKIGKEDFALRLASHQLAPALRNAVSYLCKADADWATEKVATLARTIENLALIIASENNVPLSYSSAKSTTDAIKQFVLSHFADPDFSLKIVSQALHIPCRTLQKHLQLCGSSFSEIVLNTRLANAHDLLMSGQHKMSAEDICYASGFNELSTFYRAFKVHFGVTPGALKNQLKG